MKNSFEALQPLFVGHSLAYIVIFIGMVFSSIFTVKNHLKIIFGTISLSYSMWLFALYYYGQNNPKMIFKLILISFIFTVFCVTTRLLVYKIIDFNISKSKKESFWLVFMLQLSAEMHSFFVIFLKIMIIKNNDTWL